MAGVVVSRAVDGEEQELQRREEEGRDLLPNRRKTPRLSLASPAPRLPPRLSVAPRLPSPHARREVTCKTLWRIVTQEAELAAPRFLDACALLFDAGFIRMLSRFLVAASSLLQQLALQRRRCVVLWLLAARGLRAFGFLGMLMLNAQWKHSWEALGRLLFDGMLLDASLLAGPAR